MQTTDGKTFSLSQKNQQTSQQQTKLIIESTMPLQIVSSQPQCEQPLQTGFEPRQLNSSESSQEENESMIKSKQVLQEIQAVNVLRMIEQSHPIEKKNLKADSLQHDIKLGWIPKTQITGPIPVSFNHAFLDSIIQQKHQQRKTVYLGYRPTNTFEIHQKFYDQGRNYPFYQFHLCKSQFLERFFKKYYSGFEFNANRQVGMIQHEKNLEIDEEKAQLQSDLFFDSEFEGGNLDAVYYEESEYRLLIKVDSNTRGHCNYYNFKIKCSKTGTYKFRIMNISKKKSLYERGLKPYMKILGQKSKSHEQWLQRDQSQCFHVKFGPSPLNEFLQNNGAFYSLKFQLELKKQHQYQLCYNIPYTYSELIKMIGNIRQTKNIHVGKIGYSLSGVQIPLFTIAQNQEKQQENEVKKGQQSDSYFVVITGRIHPAESNSSHIVNGLVQFLLNNSPQVRHLRKNIVFKIIPMLNPDGVICGNTRTGFAGKDLNRKFNGKTQFIFPEVNNLRDYVMKLKQKHGKRLLFVIDIHGHSTRKGSFFFGPEYPVLDEEYSKCRLLPKLYATRSEAFRYYSCKFKISEGKQATSRGYFNNHGVRTYTHETSIHSYYDFKQRKDLPFNRKSLQNLGKDLALAIMDYVQKVKTLNLKPKVVPKDIKVKTQSEKQKVQQVQQKIVDPPYQQERDSDKMPSDKADSESDRDDIEDKELNVFYQRINENREYFYEEILKSMKNKKDSTQMGPPKEKKSSKIRDQEKEEKQKQRARQRQQQKQKQKANWGLKATYTPKKTLFDEYSKLSNVPISKNTTSKPTSSIISKIKSTNMTENVSKRYSSDKNNDNFLLSFQRVKLQSSSNRIIYSVPNIKWDYNSQKVPKEQTQSNELYRYDFNDYNHLQTQQKKQRNNQGNLNSNASTIQRGQDKSQIKINKELLQKLLRPSTNMLIHEQQSKNESKFSPLKQQKSRVVSLINEKNFSSSQNNRKFLAISQMKRKQFFMDDANETESMEATYKPQIQTKKEEFLCKKWQKQILLKTKKSFSHSSKILNSGGKIWPSAGVGKNLFYENTRTELFEQKQKSTIYNQQKLISSNSPKKEGLPKINLMKKQVIVISN